MPDTTPRLSMPLILPSQAQKHVTHNEALMVLDLLTQMSFASFDESDPPAGPALGELHVVGNPANGAWAGHVGEIAQFDGSGWRFYAPLEGMVAYRGDQRRIVMFDGTNWDRSPVGSLQDIARIGLNTEATSDAPFSARLNTALWTALETADGGTGAVVQVLNREGPSADAGIVLQEAFVSRALIGQFGDNRLRLAVSQDGNQFADGVTIDNATGIVSQPNLPRFKGSTNFDNYFAEGQWQKVAINQMEFNDQNCFDPATNVFTAPVAGTYAFGGVVIYVKGVDLGKTRVRLVVNGGAPVAGSYYENSAPHVSGHTGSPVTALTQLNAGDTVELQYLIRISDGYCAANDTVFWGHKVG